jgi:hypothetical protein
MKRFGFLVLVVHLVFLSSSHAQTITSCPKIKGYDRVHTIAGYRLRIAFDGKAPQTAQCVASITRPGRKRVVFARGLSMWIDDISGIDVNQDGIPEVVFGAYSIDQGCCYEYSIVGLGSTATLVKKIHNQVPLNFRKESDGSVTIRTGDGSFDLFLLPHAQAVIPDLTLRLEGSQIQDVSVKYQKEYDEKIANAREALTPEAIAKFRSSDVHKKMFTDRATTLRSVLVVVLNYLYSGREAEAWKALEEMWPPEDEERTRSLILERRNLGLLAHLDHP